MTHRAPARTQPNPPAMAHPIPAPGAPVVASGGIVTARLGAAPVPSPGLCHFLPQVPRYWLVIGIRRSRPKARPLTRVPNGD